MSLGNKAAVVAVVCSLGLWGCARGPASGQAAAERVKTLEAKVVKLEDDFRAVATARDQARAKLSAAEEQRNQLRQELAQFQKEQNDLRVQVTARTGERDALQVQYDQFRRAIKDLLGQADAGVLPTDARPVTLAGPALPDKS